MKIAIVDGNNLAYKAYSALQESRGGLLRNSVGIPTSVIFSLLRTFSDLAKRTKFDKIILCWDTSGSYYRRGIWEYYKRNRVYKNMDDYFEELDSARTHFEIFGFTQKTLKGIEADDLIGYLSHYLRSQNHKVVIVSDDKDYYQVVKFGVKIYRPIKDQFMTIDDVVDEFDLQPKELIMAKAITGEEGDFIPGICDIDLEKMKLIKCGLGEKTAAKMIKGKKSLSQAIEDWQDPPKTKRPWKEKLLAKKNMILKSYKLARIRTKREHYQDWELKLLDEALKDINEVKEVKVKKVLRTASYLEFKMINVPFILKNLGIKLK